MAVVETRCTFRGVAYEVQTVKGSLVLPSCLAAFSGVLFSLVDSHPSSAWFPDLSL